jgi:ubiquinone/menaquinone biosynthesis C-methylase UbiE
MAGAYQSIRIAGGDTAQPLAMGKRLDVIGRHLRPGATRFLDCGCGAGDYVLALMDSIQLDAHGIEFDQEKVSKAWSKSSLKSRISQGDLQSIQSPDSNWDYALLNEVLEHVPNDRIALKEVFRILKPGGYLFIFSPNRWFPFESHGVQLKCPARGVPHWIPFIPYIPLRIGKVFFEYWARNYGQSELLQMVTDTGFTIVERDFVWLTFEGISTHQPAFIRIAKPVLRFMSNRCERIPFVRRFGVSQVIVCKK